jgi:hypothetical protein
MSYHPRLDRKGLHEAFWSGKGQTRPIAAFKVAPDFFFSRHFGAAKELLVPGRVITPDMIDVDRFLPDYERMYRTSVELDQDAFWVAEPFTGIPWMEAILGCEIRAGDASFVSRHWMASLDELDRVRLDPQTPWFLKYLEFTEKLVRLSAGRFPVGMPIMRGPSDIVGAIMGQTEMVFALADESERMKEFFNRAAEAFLGVLTAQNALIPPFEGGTALGFYHVWCPGPSVWYQEDLSAIMSPALYREFLAEPERRICMGKDHTAIHLHPASFFMLDELLAKDDLTAIEVNKDVGGPPVAEMLPQLLRIQEKKRLILWGDLDEDDLGRIERALSPQGLFLHIIAPDVGTAARLRDRVRAWKQ